MAKLKVYGGLLNMSPHREKRQVRAIAAVTSQKQMAELVGVSVSQIRGWWAETFNDHEREVALASPGVLFAAHDLYSADFEPIPKPEQ